MTEETKKDLLHNLKNRTSVHEAMFDVYKILEVSKVGIWGKSCCDRISEALPIDGNHVKLDYISNPPSILLDCVGIIKCENILKSYISGEAYNELEDFAWKLHDHARNKNHLLDALRGYTSKELRGFLKESQRKTLENVPHPELIKAELRSRRFYWRTYLKIREWIEDKLFYIKNYSIIHLIKETARECFNNPDLGQISAPKKRKNEVFGDAYMRFIDKHKDYTNLQKMSRENLKKYVFLGVNYFGRRPDHIHRIRPTEEDLEAKYTQINHVMQAVGMLTPTTLQQMFPVIKDYDGEKYGCKDYFYTMKTIARFKPDEPIGSAQEAAQLLWDYENDSLRFFVMVWLGCIEDLHIYADKSDEYDAFYNGLKSRHSV